MQPLIFALAVIALVIVAILSSRNPIVRKLSRRVVVEVNPERFVFSSGSVSFELATFMYVTRAENRVVAIGEEVDDRSGSDVLRIHLFERDSSFGSSVDRFDALRTFFNYGIRRALKGIFIIRPTVVIKGVETFDTLFCGYQKGLFRAATASEIYDVVFE